MENDKVKDYINKVCMLIKNKDVHYDINLELQDHIETLKEDFINSGLSEEEATEKALSHMGDPSLIGTQLNKTHKAKIGWGVIIPLLCFSLFGLVTMYFIQSKGAVAEADYIKMFQKNLIFYILGIGLITGLYFFDYRRILPYSKQIYIGTLVVLILQLFFNVPVNGHYYFYIGFLTIDLMPFCLLFLVVSLAGIFEGWDWNNLLGFLKALGLIIVPGLLITIIPGYLTLTATTTYSFLYFIACITLMFMSKAKISQVLFCIISPVFSIFIYTLFEPYRLRRFTIFLDPASDPTNSGWIYLQLKKAVESAGAFGNGFTMEPKTIPELHTDFVFTYIVYTFGWIAAVAIITLIIIFLLKIISVAKVTKNSYGKLIVSGFIAILTTEFLLNIAMNFGIAPIMGISLPFMSFGGSQLLINMTIVGLILSVYRRKDITHNMVKKEVI